MDEGKLESPAQLPEVLRGVTRVLREGGVALIHLVSCCPDYAHDWPPMRLGSGRALWSRGALRFNESVAVLDERLGMPSGNGTVLDASFWGTQFQPVDGASEYEAGKGQFGLLLHRRAAPVTVGGGADREPSAGDYVMRLRGGYLPTAEEAACSRSPSCEYKRLYFRAIAELMRGRGQGLFN